MARLVPMSEAEFERVSSQFPEIGGGRAVRAQAAVTSSIKAQSSALIESGLVIATASGFAYWQGRRVGDPTPDEKDPSKLKYGPDNAMPSVGNISLDLLTGLVLLGGAVFGGKYLGNYTYVARGIGTGALTHWGMNLAYSRGFKAAKDKAAGKDTGKYEMGPAVPVAAGGMPGMGAPANQAAYSQADVFGNGARGGYGPPVRRAA